MFQGKHALQQLQHAALCRPRCKAFLAGVQFQNPPQNLAGTSTHASYLPLPVLFLLNDVKKVWIDLLQGRIELLWPLHSTEAQ